VEEKEGKPAWGDRGERGGVGGESDGVGAKEKKKEKGREEFRSRQKQTAEKLCEGMEGQWAGKVKKCEDKRWFS